MPKKATKGIGRKFKTNVREEASALPSRSQMHPPEVQMEGVETSNLEMEWSEATSIRIYNNSSLELEEKQVAYVTTTDEVEEINPNTFDEKI